MIVKLLLNIIFKGHAEIAEIAEQREQSQTCLNYAES